MCTTEGGREPERDQRALSSSLVKPIHRVQAAASWREEAAMPLPIAQHPLSLPVLSPLSPYLSPSLSRSLSLSLSLCLSLCLSLTLSLTLQSPLTYIPLVPPFSHIWIYFDQYQFLATVEHIAQEGLCLGFSSVARRLSMRASPIVPFPH